MSSGKTSWKSLEGKGSCSFDFRKPFLYQVVLEKGYISVSRDSCVSYGLVWVGKKEVWFGLVSAVAKMPDRPSRNDRETEENFCSQTLSFW